MHIIDYSNKEEIKLDGGGIVTIGEIMISISKFINFKQINEIRLFGSCIDKPKETIIKGERYFFGFLKEKDEIKYKYPNDIDVLVLTTSKSDVIRKNLPVNGLIICYGESFGYGYCYQNNGVIADKIHCLYVNSLEFNRNLKKKDPTTVSINNKCRVIYNKKG